MRVSTISKIILLACQLFVIWTLVFSAVDWAQLVLISPFGLFAFFGSFVYLIAKIKKSGMSMPTLSPTQFIKNMEAPDQVEPVKESVKNDRSKLGTLFDTTVYVLSLCFAFSPLILFFVLVL